MMTSLTMATVRARIFTLPNRPPFMMARDLADFYQVETKRIMQQVRRNLGRFPADFIFELTSDEVEAKSTHFGETSQGRRTDLTHYGFTREGALQLSSVLTGPVADEVSVTIIRTFAELERQALAEVQHRLARLQSEARGRRPIRSRIVDAAREGWSFEQLWRDGNWSRAKLAEAMQDCVALGLIAAPLPGGPATQLGLFGAVNG